jgi:uncharacterized membrane protein YdjX (TVP38/TMEM64 family)
MKQSDVLFGVGAVLGAVAGFWLFRGAGDPNIKTLKQEYREGKKFAKQFGKHRLVVIAGKGRA